VQPGDDIPSLLKAAPGWAYLDWITGIIRVDADPREYEALMDKMSGGSVPRAALTEKEVLLLETLTHETTHLLQICTTGFLYWIAREMSDALREYLLELEPKSYEDLPRVAPESVTRRFQKFKRYIDARGPHGLTVRSLAESTAFMTQKRTHWVGLNAEDYADLLAGQADEYRAAYDFAVEKLGPTHAFQMCPLLTFFALCCTEPVKMFIALCERMRQELANGTHLKKNLLELRDEVASQISSSVIGIPHPDTNGKHLVYGPIVLSLYALNQARQFDFVQYWAKPYELDSSAVAEAVAPPMMFNPSSDGILVLSVSKRFSPNAKRIGDPPGELSQATQVLMILHEISTRLQG
jgi:hypothetical protein